MATKIKVTLIRARDGGNKHQQAVLVGLNLRKTNSSQMLEDTPSIRGMIRKVAHMVRVDPA